ncbi:MAG: hypothetical protein DME18_12720, partial [Verrucomicrobia bacterium]
ASRSRADPAIVAMAIQWNQTLALTPTLSPQGEGELPLLCKSHHSVTFPSAAIAHSLCWGEEGQGEG